jgi:hypothetical protein
MPSPTMGRADGPRLAMVNAYLVRVQIGHVDGGTNVTMASRPVPLLDAE